MKRTIAIALLLTVAGLASAHDSSFHDNSSRVATVDSVSNAGTTIDSTHHECHDGDCFFLFYSVADLGAMTTPDDTITLGWTTPNTTQWGHFVFEVTGTAGWQIRLIEAPTGGKASPTGQLTILNNNRNSATTSTFIGSGAGSVDYDATLATGGTTLINVYIPGGSGPFASSASANAREEIMLKQNTYYQLSAFGTDNNPATLHVSWYEHTSVH